MRSKYSHKCVGIGRHGVGPAALFDAIAKLDPVGDDIPNGLQLAIAEQSGEGRNAVTIGARRCGCEADAVAAINAYHVSLLPMETRILQRAAEFSTEPLPRFVCNFQNRAILISPLSEPRHRIVSARYVQRTRQEMGRSFQAT